MKAKYTFVLVLIFSVLEVVSQTYWPRYGSKDIAAVVYFISGILIALLPLVRTVHEPDSQPDYSRKLRIWKVSFFALLGVGIIYFGCQAVEGQPLDYTFSDMLPIIKIMGERWIAQEGVYNIIPEIWDGMQPIYLPTMWMPYVVPILFDFDVRVVNLVFIIIASGLATHFWQRTNSHVPNAHWYVYIPLLILLSYILINYTTFITISEEPVVVGYYMLLGYSIYQRKTGWTILALSLCLLSRYTLVFWAFTFLVYSLYNKNYRREAAITILGTGILCLLLLLISQGIYQIDLFYSLKDAYLDSFLDPDLAWRTKNTVVNNIGVARFLPFEQLINLHSALFWGSFILPPALYVWYHLKLRGHIELSFFALCSLKMCLVYFYNMNALPYSYLFYTSTFLSFIVLQAYLSKCMNSRKAT